MKTKIILQKPKGMRKKDCYDQLTNYMWNLFRVRVFDGQIGKDNIFSLDEIRQEVSRFLDKKRWILKEDKLNIDRYQLYIERTTDYVMHKLTSPNTGNTYFFRGLLNEPGNGYFIAISHEETQENKKIKQEHIDGCQTALDHRIIEADRNVEMLTSGKKPEQLRQPEVQ
jgi:hypothetical protein